MGFRDLPRDLRSWHKSSASPGFLLVHCFGRNFFVIAPERTVGLISDYSKPHGYTIPILHSSIGFQSTSTSLVKGLPMINS
ncbi:hypothetical protein L6452_09030 [Arctium lappa]|uniref:Uncharacterized protein n=1 Tax=Arctium lappa TaxID=4217 RepID=A0ACB9DIW9_ARCLA|nr:hypothetical protein L6452_09030 [Arctium lappa]